MHLIHIAGSSLRLATSYLLMVVLSSLGIMNKVAYFASPGTATPWEMGAELPAFDEDVWELYDLTTDWTQARDLAREMPDKLRHLQR